MDVNPALSDRTPRSPKFDLIDASGLAVTERSYAGKYLLVYFGFTRCKVVCPRSLSKLTAVLEKLGPLETRIQPLYITVDPKHDTPATMKAFLEGRYPRFAGLTGERRAVEAAKRNFRVFTHTLPDPDDPPGYIVPHTAFVYFLDPEGRYLTHFTDTATEAAIASRIEAAIPRHDGDEKIDRASERN